MENKMIDLNWKTLIINDDTFNASPLKNALFYSDEVIWLPSDFIYSFLYISLAKFLGDIPEDLTNKIFIKNEDEGINLADWASNRLYESVQKNKKEYQLQNLNHNLTKDALRILFIKYAYFYSNMGHLHDLGFQQSEKIPELLTSAARMIREGKEESFLKTIEAIRPNIFSIEFPGIKNTELNHWSDYTGVKELRNAMIQTQILPDITALEFTEIARLKSLVKDEFILMRAELQEMSEVLDNMIKEDQSQENISKQALKLIKSRVEPVLLRYNVKIRSELKSKFKKHVAQIVKVVGFSALGKIYPSAFSWAIKDGVNLFSDIVSTDTNIKPATDTARFIIKLNNAIEKK